MLRKLRFSVVLVVSGTFVGVLGTSWVPAAQAAVTSSNSKNRVYKPWPMHHVCRDFLIANSLNAADVDGDGFDDYSVIDERRGLMTVIFHPGKRGDVRKEWPRLVLGQTGSPEYACLGDVDGDGAPDFIVVEGDDLSKGLPTGVRIIWNPGKTKARDSAAWPDAGRVPGTENAQYLCAECHDMNGDGATKQYAGLRWLRAPTHRTARRDLSQRTTHFLDPDTPSGHGFVFADLNGDGGLNVLGTWRNISIKGRMGRMSPGSASSGLRTRWNELRRLRASKEAAV